ncbi:ATP-dependent Clp protease adapter ClpS [Demequina oxidasica]|uniref:ATP-dependent Clp protease adapter ClpS n=1 Tax=Demequina oxidasica TaxID=676199 RepID=UPI000781F1DA|nr:ATP-dependent Clp protease adapter ClpS [Demequina oxidasica]
MDSQEQLEPEGNVATRLDDAWVTIVWNDPVNLMSYVTHVFQSYFGFTRQAAEARMQEVHENGKSVVSSGGREKMEVDVQAMHGYGLWATMQRSGQ